MKSLTIKELKALEIGDYVWVVNLYVNAGRYRQIESRTLGGIYLNGYYNFDTYGKTWIAYKNKEQWENKEDFVYLPRKCGHEIVYIDSSDGVLNAKIVTGYLVHHYEIGNSGLDLAVFYNPYTNEKHSEAICHYGTWWFATEEEAEARLKELTGE